MSNSLAEKVAVVTGGASGIGYGIVKRFIEEGAKVAIFDIANAQEAGRALGAAAALTVDITEAPTWEKSLREVASRFGGLHVLVNNVAISGQLQTPVGEYPPEEFERVMRVNLIGAFLGHRFGIPHLLRSWGGVIVNISSGAAVKTTNGICAYNASKAALESLTRTAACEYASQGVRVNVVRPGMTDTPLFARSLEENPDLRRQIADSHPMGRLGTPAEVAAAVAFLASDDASLITGASLSADGGYLAT